MNNNYRTHRKPRKDILGAIEFIFKFMEQRVKVEILLTNIPNTRYRGIIRGFDEWMNLVLEQVVEFNVKTGKQKPLGRMLLKGETICVIHILDPYSEFYSDW